MCRVYDGVTIHVEIKVEKVGKKNKNFWALKQVLAH